MQTCELLTLVHHELETILGRYFTGHNIHARWLSELAAAVHTNTRSPADTYLIDCEFSFHYPLAQCTSSSPTTSRPMEGPILPQWPNQHLLEHQNARPQPLQQQEGIAAAAQNSQAVGNWGIGVSQETRPEGVAYACKASPAILAGELGAPAWELQQRRTDRISPHPNLYCDHLHQLNTYMGAERSRARVTRQQHLPVCSCNLPPCAGFHLMRRAHHADEMPWYHYGFCERPYCVCLSPSTQSSRHFWCGTQPPGIHRSCHEPIRTLGNT
jgi:hypothetical protein